MDGFDRNCLLGGLVYAHHEVAAIEYHVGAHLAVEVRSWRTAEDREGRPTEFHTTRLLDYDAADAITLGAAYELVTADERFAEYVDPAQAALDEVLPLLTDEQAEQVPQVHPLWTVGVSYEVGDRVRYDGRLYRCVQAHASAEGYEPPTSPALWTRNGASGEIEEWVQPTGAQDAYNEGDRVTHNGKTWVSTCDHNVWEPGVYGWDEVA